MTYTERIKGNLYGFHMNLGKIEKNNNEIVEKCFFIVDKPAEAEFIHRKVRQLYLAGCRSFVFFGKETLAWHNESDTEIIDLYIDDKDVAVTYDFSDIEDFVDDIKDALSIRPFVPTVNYLFYDNYEIYQSIKEKIK